MNASGASILVEKGSKGLSHVKEVYHICSHDMEEEGDGTEVVVRVELPGFELEEVKVEVVGESLTVEAEHKEPVEKKEGKEKEKVERGYAHVKRMVTLPPEV